ncbi:zinc finger CCHC domain-containing protein 24 [Bombyx mori]|uniref:Uncharacterized protein n=1 Tax=Bombyx mori TaxID=7091 RepID=A0A8R2ANL8_BOMMO|nr:zinc finger CCHC domain-containing protein 24 [Bombyx mori]
MGCFWSSECDSRERCQHCNRRAVNNLIVVNQVCEICTYNSSKQTSTPHSSGRNKPCFGKYICVCGNAWSSRKSWPQKYQICTRCRKKVYARTQRPLRSSDWTNNKNSRDHLSNLCQMCQELGYDCGKLFEI